MRLARFGWLAFFTLAALGACSSDDTSPADAELESAERFCEGVVQAACETLASCCDSQTKFDPFECRRVELAGCLSMVGMKRENAGVLRFDAEAAATCLVAPTSCPSSAHTEISREQTIACNNIVTGPSPLGAGCTDDSDCASVGPGAYPSCFRPAGSSSGVCAKTVYSADDSCGFFANSLEHRLCPESKQCRIPASALPSEDAKGRARFDIHGQCQPLAKVGQVCGPDEAGGYVECEKGLLCRHTGGAQPVCAQPKTKGQECAITEECAAGLFCNPENFLCDDFSDISTLYCYEHAAPGGGGDGGSGGQGGQGGGGETECAAAYMACSTTSDCCSGLACQTGICLPPPSQCVDDGEYCTSNAQCCAGSCNNNICNGIATCVPQYGTCTAQNDCCSGYVCDNGMCL